jgi:hypothetical protein
MAIKKNYKFRNERKLQRGKGKMNMKKAEEKTTQIHLEI